MKAIISTKYGGPEILKLKEVEKPSPKDNEVRVKIYATSVTKAETMMRTGKPYLGRLIMGFSKPKNPISGTSFAGVIESVGKDVSLFKLGDNVFGESIDSFGTYAEFVCVLEDGMIAELPNTMTFEEAAGTCDGALTSMNFLTKVVQIEKGQKVLINGASGSLGTAAVQLAKHFGAEVTGVCSTSNIAMVKSLGADNVIDYTKLDFTKTGQTYDIIYDTVGKRTFSDCKKALTENGAYISPVLGLPLLIDTMVTSMFGTKKAKFSATGMLPIKEQKVLLGTLIEIIEKNKLKSIIDRVFSLEQIPTAHEYVDMGHKKGNVVILNKQ